MKTKRFVKSYLKTFGRVTEDHLRFSAVLVQNLVDKGPVSLGDLEEETGINMRRLKNFAKKRPRTTFGEDHKITAHGPISLNEASEKIIYNEKTFYASQPWAALSSVFYVDAPVVWQGQCKVSEAPIEVKLYPEGMETELENVYISFLAPDDLSIEKFDQIEEWCHVLLGDEATEKYLNQHQERVAIPLSQAYQFARDVFDSWSETPKE